MFSRHGPWPDQRRRFNVASLSAPDTDRPTQSNSLPRQAQHGTRSPQSQRRSRTASRSWSLCRAQGDPAGPRTLTAEEAYERLGLKPGSSSFEDCVQAKNKLLSRYEGDQDKCSAVLEAYDVLFSQQLSARLRGELPVSSKVRFADVPQRTTKKVEKSPLSNIGLPGGGVQLLIPRSNQLAVQAAIFGGLAAWVLIQDWVQPTALGGAADVPGLQLSLGAAAAVYLLREQKRASLWKALGLAVGGLVLGSLLGSLVESWLRVDIVPLGGINAPATIVGEFGLAGLFAAAVLLG